MSYFRALVAGHLAILEVAIASNAAVVVTKHFDIRTFPSLALSTGGTLISAPVLIEFSWRVATGTECPVPEYTLYGVLLVFTVLGGLIATISGLIAGRRFADRRQWWSGALSVYVSAWAGLFIVISVAEHW